MIHRKKWSNEDLDYLKEHWGITPIKNMAKNLRRSENGIVVKARRLKLGAFLDSG